MQIIAEIEGERISAEVDADVFVELTYTDWRKMCDEQPWYAPCEQQTAQEDRGGPAEALMGWMCAFAVCATVWGIVAWFLWR
jgi:hypothetical protein